MQIRICHGTSYLNSSNKASARFGPFTGTPSVTATVVGSLKNGPTVCIRSKSSRGCTFAAFYNGGLELTEGKIDWIAVGPCHENPRCCYDSKVDCDREVFS